MHNTFHFLHRVMHMYGEVVLSNGISVLLSQILCCFLWLYVEMATRLDRRPIDLCNKEMVPFPSMVIEVHKVQKMRIMQ